MKLSQRLLITTIMVFFVSFYFTGLQAQNSVLCDKLIDKDGKKYLEGETNAFTGKCVILDSKGKLMLETPYVDGIANGLETAWFEDGTKKWEINIKNGNFNGKSTFYFENGKIRSEETYVNDYKFGRAVHYYENGTKEGEGLYDNCRETGTWFFYYPNGQLKAQGEYKLAEKTGKWKYWNKNGEPVSEEPKE